MIYRLLGSKASLRFEGHARRASIAALNRWPVAALWQVPQILAANWRSPLFFVHFVAY
jgi:hypothetical protein